MPVQYNTLIILWIILKTMYNNVGIEILYDNYNGAR